MKYLATYDGASTAELVEVKAAAVRGCIGAVKAPIVSFTEQVGGCGDVHSSVVVFLSLGVVLEVSSLLTRRIHAVSFEGHRSPS